MSKKSFKDLIDSLEKENYKFNFFYAETIGNHLPEDSDWNYKDVPHSKFVHEDLSSIQVCTLEDTSGSINILKLPFFGLSVPLATINYEQSRFNQIYFSSFGPYILIVNTISTKIDSDKTKVKTSYAIGSKGLFKYFHKIIERVILKNYNKLMLEDVPMRQRRGELRKSGHKFYSDNKTSFKFTEEINRANVYLDEGIGSEINIKKSSLLSSKKGDRIGQSSGILSFFITEEDNIKKLWPTTCSHEGAYLDNKCIRGEKIFCPWHNKITKPLLIIGDKEKNKFNILPCVDYLTTDEKETIKIKFRNDPKYYNKNYKQ